MRVVATADPHDAGPVVGVLLLCLYNIKIMGFGGWVHELFTAPSAATRSSIRSTS